MKTTCQDALQPGEQPFTVILMLPDFIRSDEACEADWVRRMWITARNPTEAQWEARSELAILLEWEQDTHDLDDLSVVAIYSGHVYDLFEPYT